VFNECKKSSDYGWTLAIALPRHTRDNARFVFTVYQDGAKRETDVYAHRAYDPNVWINVAVTFDGTNARLYVSGAEIVTSLENEGPLFQDSSAKCVGLFLGGSQDKDTFFRGKLAHLKLWDRQLSHSEIVHQMTNPGVQPDDDFGLILHETFADLSNWEVLSDISPIIGPSDHQLTVQTISLEAPSCGRTVCDDPEVVMSYLNSTELRNRKRVRYRIVNIFESNGKNGLVDDKDIFEQHKVLNDAFEPYDIRFEMQNIEISNSSFADKVIMFDCAPFLIGNGHCDPECAHSTTGNDGGDCDHVKSECLLELLGNGVCNPECNKGYHGYDGGDCCRSDSKKTNMCIDPESTMR